MFVLSANILKAQNIKGIVLDDKLKKPLAGVSIYYNNSKSGTFTDEKGEFYTDDLSEIKENDTLCFSHIGYLTKKITFSELKENNCLVLLFEDVQDLNEVIIKSKRKLKSYIHYKELSSSDVGLCSFGSALVGDKIYIIGGDKSLQVDEVLKALHYHGDNFQEHIRATSEFPVTDYSGSLHIYDIQEDNWISSDLKFRERAYHNIHYFKGKIFVLGGKRLSPYRRFVYLDEKTELYDIMRDTILLDNVNPHQAANFASFMYGDILIVIGGSVKLNIDEEKVYTAKVHSFYTKSGYWYELNDMPNPKETKGVLIKNTIYLIGGYNHIPLKEIETYNLITAEWKVEGQLFYGVERPALTYNENIIYIFEDGKIQTYNIKTKELNMYSIDLPLKYSELFYANNILYIFGGFQENGFSVTPSSNLYSIDLNEFKKTVINKTKIF